MTWTNETERIEFEETHSHMYFKKERDGDPCPRCSQGRKSAENKHVINFDCGHTVKKSDDEKVAYTVPKGKTAIVTVKGTIK